MRPRSAVKGPRARLRCAGGTAPSGRGCAPRPRRRGAGRTRGAWPARSRGSPRPGTPRPTRRRRRRTHRRRRPHRSPGSPHRRRARPSSRQRARGGAGPRRPRTGRSARAPTDETRTRGGGRSRWRAARRPLSVDRCSTAATNASWAVGSSWSPRWPDIHASRPSATQKALAVSPPTASDGGTSTGSRIGSGARPRERRTGSSRPATARVTESSQGTGWAGRARARHRQARRAGRVPRGRR